jgi:hypothetical protein
MIAPMGTRQTAAAHPGAPGFLVIYEAADVVMSIWSYDISSITKNTRGVGSQISVKSSGAWFASELTPGELMAATASAMMAYTEAERMARIVPQAA